MVSKKITAERDPLLQLAQCIAEQRGERMGARTITAYTRSLTQRMHDMCARLQRPLTGKELFDTIPRHEALTWEDVPADEQSLYTTVVKNFNEAGTKDQIFHGQPVREEE